MSFLSGQMRCRRGQREDARALEDCSRAASRIGHSIQCQAARLRHEGDLARTDRHTLDGTNGWELPLSVTALEADCKA